MAYVMILAFCLLLFIGNHFGLIYYCLSIVDHVLHTVVKVSILRLFSHLERMKSEEFMNKVYVSEAESPRRRERVDAR